MSTYYYLDEKDAICSTGSLYLARRGTIRHLFAHPNHEFGFITTSPNALMSIKKGFKGQGDDAYSEYDYIDGPKRSKSIIEQIYDDGRSF